MALRRQKLPDDVEKLRDGVYRYRGFIIKRKADGTRCWSLFLPWNVDGLHGRVQRRALIDIGSLTLASMRTYVDAVLNNVAGYQYAYWGDNWVSRLTKAQDHLPLFLAQLGNHRLPTDGELMKHIREVLDGENISEIYPGTPTLDPIYP